MRLGWLRGEGHAGGVAVGFGFGGLTRASGYDECRQNQGTAKIQGRSKTRTGQKLGEPRCEGDTWGTHFASLSAPVVDGFLWYPRENLRLG